MIAIKYEEIYPPTLDQIQTRIGTHLDYKEYVQLEVEILKKLDYNITVESPIKYMKDLNEELSNERKS